MLDRQTPLLNFRNNVVLGDCLDVMKDIPDGVL